MQAGGGTDGTGQTIGGRYRPLAPLGSGSTGTVWRAQDLQLGREVALKVLRGDAAGDPAFADAFARETRAAARLNHPGVVAVLDAGTDPAGPWIAMELVDGGDLGTLVAQRGPLTPTATARIGTQVAEALAAAHALGIVHRDVKPANLLLVQRTGAVKLADLGIAHLAGAAADPAGMTAGSIHHLAPEQLRGEPATPAADVYALGVTLFELLTGRRAFAGESADAIARARLAGQVPAPSLVRPDTPADLDAAIRWMLAPDPLARPSAAEAAGVLGRLATPPPQAAPPPPPAPMA
ncbi:MAG: serine/threonine-protein kinase, partial [Chloroflexota bacterium]